MPSSDDVWEVLSTARTIRRFTDEPVDDATLTRCLEAALNLDQFVGVAHAQPDVIEAAARHRSARDE